MLKIPLQWIENAINEDAPYGDPASELAASNKAMAKGVLLSKDQGTICGMPLIQAFFNYMDPQADIDPLVEDGEKITKHQKLCYIKCNTYTMLRTERIILNLLSYLSGIATEAQKLADLIKPYGVKLLDTRKILPHYRWLVKYAVRTGGGCNHRNSLSDLVMLKDNHIQSCGGISATLNQWNFFQRYPMLKLEVEVGNLEEALEALPFQPDLLMLDNFSLQEAEVAIRSLKGKVLLEISGGITHENIESYAKLGPDFISSGSMTHHVKGLDISLDIQN